MTDDPFACSRRRFLGQVSLGALAGAAGAWLPEPIFARQGDEPTTADREAMGRLAAAFMAKHGVPGLSVAIARRGRQVYVEGFGVADKATGEAVKPSHLFRIASVSKPFTSATIFSLIEDGRLHLTDRVFGQGAVLGTAFGGPPYRPHVEAVTIHHLLTHSAGGWQNDDTDPMFSNPRMDHRQLIAWTLEHLPLTYEPGTHYAYSNFGFCVLGRVIEKITGTPYDEAVRSIVLRRCGITAMRIAGNTLADRAPNEVVYYGQGSENPYRMQVTRMDSHGGWLASPSDLVRFLLRVDRFPTVPDILRPDTLATMTSPSTANPGYACGWMVNAQHNYWHNGSLPGTTTIMVRTSAEFCWAALTNTRQPASTIAADLDSLIWAMVRSVRNWS